MSDEMGRLVRFGGQKTGRLAEAVAQIKATPGAVLSCTSEDAALRARERYDLSAEQVTWPRRDLLGTHPDWTRLYAHPWIG